MSEISTSVSGEVDLVITPAAGAERLLRETLAPSRELTSEQERTYQDLAALVNVVTPPRPDPIDPDPDTVDPAMLIGAGTSDAPTATATRPVSPDTEETAP